MSAVDHGPGPGLYPDRVRIIYNDGQAKEGQADRLRQGRRGAYSGPGSSSRFSPAPDSAPPPWRAPLTPPTGLTRAPDSGAEVPLSYGTPISSCAKSATVSSSVQSPTVPFEFRSSRARITSFPS